MTTSMVNGRSTDLNGRGEDTGTDVSGVADVLAVLRREALEVGAQATRPVGRVRLSVGDVVLEVDWTADSATTATRPGGPVAAPREAPAQPPAPAGPALPAQAGPPDSRDDDLAFVVPAHTVGVFYHAPEPGADPFVRPGDAVVPGQQVGIIEAMKLMIPVEAERGGRVREVLVPDATPVEYGQPLLTLDVSTPGGGSS